MKEDAMQKITPTSHVEAKNKMIVHQLFSGIFLCLTFVVTAQGQSFAFRADSAAIVAIAQQLLDAVGKGDTAVWKKYLHPDCIIIAEDGALKRKKEIINEIHPLPTGYAGSIKVAKPVMINHQDTFILSFIADEHLTLYGQTIHTSYAETDTYVKSKTGWSLLASEIFELPADPVRMNVAPDVLQTYAGTYQLAEGVEYKITLENSRLFGQRTSKPATELLPETESVFFVKGQRGRKIFIKDNAGDIVKMLDRRSGHDLVWTKIK